MSRIKTILLGLGAVIAVSATMVSSASAWSLAYFEAGSKAITTSTGVEGTVGVAQFQSMINTTKIIIVCSNNVFSAKIEGGTSEGKIEYKSCRLYTVKEGVKKDETTNCPVTEPIKFEFKDKLILQSKAGVVADEFEPKTSTLFVEIEIGGASCLLTGGTKKKLKVEGTYTASLGDQAEELNTEHELVFTEAGGAVQFESKVPAAYTNTVSKLKLSTGKEWYVD